MKTIEFQKDETIKNNVTVSVNGRLYTISNQSLAITVTDDKPVKVKIKNTHLSWWGSKKYTFEPKESIALQISEDRRATKRFRVLTISVIMFYLALMVIGCYFEGLSWFLVPQGFIVVYPFFIAINGKSLIIIEHEND